MSQARADEEVWSDVLCFVRDRLQDKRACSEFDTMFVAHAKLVAIQDGVAIVEIENRHYISWAADHYKDVLVDAFSRLLDQPIDVRLTSPTTKPSATPTPRPKMYGGTLQLNPAMTMESFVVGGCNRIAHAAAMSVLEDLGAKWNPLYIYGVTGLGKTHLLHAIGHEVMVRDPHARVVYVSADNFVNDYVQSIRNQTVQTFRLRYHEEATILLLDDIQFLGGKNSTQEELFYVFNALAAQNRQMVFTSDVSPSEIAGLEQRLRSRFQGGQVVDMQAPDYETARAILEQRAADVSIYLEPELADMMAKMVYGNVRQLLGALNKLVLRVQQDKKQAPGKPVTVAFAQTALPSMFAAPKSRLAVSDILTTVARVYNLRTGDLTGKSRMKHFVEPRHLAMYLARKYTGLSYPQLGAEFGGRDHTTIVNGVKRVQERIETRDVDTVTQLTILEQQLDTHRH